MASLSVTLMGRRGGWSAPLTATRPATTHSSASRHVWFRACDRLGDPSSPFCDEKPAGAGRLGDGRALSAALALCDRRLAGLLTPDFSSLVAACGAMGLHADKWSTGGFLRRKVCRSAVENASKSKIWSCFVFQEKARRSRFFDFEAFSQNGCILFARNFPYSTYRHVKNPWPASADDDRAAFARGGHSARRDILYTAKRVARLRARDIRTGLRDYRLARLNVTRYLYRSTAACTASAYLYRKPLVNSDPEGRRRSSGCPAIRNGVGDLTARGYCSSQMTAASRWNCQTAALYQVIRVCNTTLTRCRLHQLENTVYREPRQVMTDDDLAIPRPAKCCDAGNIWIWLDKPLFQRRSNSAFADESRRRICASNQAARHRASPAYHSPIVKSGPERRRLSGRARTGRGELTICRQTHRSSFDNSVVAGDTARWRKLKGRFRVRSPCCYTPTRCRRASR